MNKLKLSLLGFLILILLAANTYAVPPVTQTALSQNLDIKYPPTQYFPINKNISFDFHVFNVTGNPLSNSTTSCAFHLYDTSGNHILQVPNVKYDTSDGDWSIPFNDKNNSQIRILDFIFYCNNTLNGGSVSGSFLFVADINKFIFDGEGVPNYDIVLVFGMLAIAFFLIYFSEKFKVDGEHFVKAITALCLNLIFKLTALATIIFDLFFIKDLIPNSPVFTDVFSIYLNLFAYGVGVIFFILYLINSVVTLLYNFNLKKQNERKYG